MTKKTIAIISMVLAFILLTALSVAAKELSVKDILTKVDSLGYLKSSKIYMTQTVEVPSGDKRTFKMVSYSQDGNDKGLTEYLAPKQVAGMKILTLNDGDDIWTYFPRTNRVRKIASSARNRKVQGSDFTYDDMAAGKMANSWTGTVAGTEKIHDRPCFKLNLKPTENGPRSYSKAIAWVDKANFTTARVEYYDQDGDKLKRLDISHYKKIDGVNVPHQYVMTNLIDGGKTTMKVAHAQVNIKLDATLFNDATLGK